MDEYHTVDWNRGCGSSSWSSGAGREGPGPESSWANRARKGDGEQLQPSGHVLLDSGDGNGDSHRPAAGEQVPNAAWTPAPGDGDHDSHRLASELGVG
jgi:hypothetical protein